MSEPAVSREAPAPSLPAPPAAAPPGRPAGANPYLRRNLTLLTLDGAFFMAGSAFYDSGTVLPTLVSTLTSSKALIGLAAAMRTIGWFLPQLIVASLTEHLRYKGRLVVVNSLVHRALLLVMAAVIYFHAGTRPGLALALFFPVFVVSCISEGVNGVPWTDVVANTIPPDRRGRLFANQQILGGLWAFGNGFLVRLILNDAPYPDAYAILFLCTFVTFSLSVLSFMGVREQPVSEVGGRRSLLDYLGSLPAAWKGNRDFARVMVVRFCLAFLFLSVPFFVLHSRENLGADIGTVGLFVSAQMLGSLVGSAVAGRISDRTGNRVVVILAVAASFLAPAVAVLLTAAHSAGATALAMAVFPAVYFFVGWTFGAGYIGFTNYVIDVSPAAQRATFIGLSNTLMAPFAFLAAAGGLLATLAGYPAVFLTSAFVGAIGVALAFRLPEPRRRQVPLRSEPAGENDWGPEGVGVAPPKETSPGGAG